MTWEKRSRPETVQGTSGLFLGRIIARPRCRNAIERVGAARRSSVRVGLAVVPLAPSTGVISASRGKVRGVLLVNLR